MSRYTTYLQEDPEDVKGDIFRGLHQQINTLGEKREKERIRKQIIADKLRQAIIQGVTSGKIKTRQGADLSGLGDLDLEGAEFGRTLGRLGGAFEPVTDKYKARVTRSQIPFSDVLKAREEMARTPEEWVKAGMGTTTTTPASGILGRLAPGIFNKKTYGLSPEAEKIQEMARGIINKPYKESISMSGVDIEGEGEIDEETQALIEEYETTNDPARLQEIEDELISRGVNFQ